MKNIFDPKTVALIGATEKDGFVGAGAENFGYRKKRKSSRYYGFCGRERFRRRKKNISSKWNSIFRDFLDNPQKPCLKLIFQEFTVLLKRSWKLESLIALCFFNEIFTCKCRANCLTCNINAESKCKGCFNPGNETSGMLRHRDKFSE